MNNERRKLLKLLAFGGATFFAGKFFGNALNHWRVADGKETYFKNFKVVESSKQLGVYESGGEQILVIEKESY